MACFAPHKLPLTAYETSLVELAREVGRTVCQYGDEDILNIVEWLVATGNAMQGKPAGWIASAYRAGNLQGKPGRAL